MNRRDFLKGIAGAAATVPAIILAPRLAIDIPPTGPPPFAVRDVITHPDGTLEVEIRVDDCHLDQMIEHMEGGLFSFPFRKHRVHLVGRRTCVGWDAQDRRYVVFAGRLGDASWS